ncbi:DNA methyltransferase [Streptomyces niveus]
MRTGRVLDPFSGTGTTCAAAAGAGLASVGVDLDASCHVLAAQRFRTP